MDKNKLVYIYNPIQYRFYKEHGLKPIDSDMHYKTKKVFWVFVRADTKEVFEKWCARNK